MKTSLRTTHPALIVVLAALIASASCSDSTAPTDPQMSNKAALSAPLPGASIVPSVANISKLALGSTTVAIGGPGTGYKVLVVNNTLAALPGVLLQGELVQRGRSNAAGGFVVSCPTPNGILPPGPCTMAFTINASADAPLLPGPADFVLSLLQSVPATIFSKPTTKLLDQKTVAITLVRPSISSLVLSSTLVTIGGPGTNYNVDVLNPTGANQPGVLLQGELVQGGTTRGAGGFIVYCPAVDGNLPPGTCSMSFTINATNDGSFVPGPATFQLALIQSVGGVSHTLDTRTVAVTLVGPTISNLVLSSTNVALGGPGTSYTVSILNPTGVNQSLVIIQGELIQGATTRGAGGSNVQCATGSGVLPPGTCTMTFTINATGDGSLVAGPATFRLSLMQFDGTTTTTLDTRTVAVTLVQPSISSLVLSSTDVKIGGPGTSYTVSVLNPGLNRPGVLLQGVLLQGAVTTGAGGFTVHCPAVDGNLPPGTCTMSFTINATGNGSLVAGPANFRLDLIQVVRAVSTTLDSRTVAVNLVP